ncbi:hypothetical protein OAA18_00520 [bacterium]|nr:hypothetical protein [bacterium]
MEDLKKIQEFFSKPLDEVMSLDDEAKAYYLAKVKRGEIDTLPENPKAAFLAQMTKDQMDHDKETLRRERGLEENVFVEAFKLQKALKGMGYDVKVKAVDDFGTNVFEIYFNNPADADDDSIFYDVKKLGYDNVRVFANPQESIDEASKEEETEFHTKLDKLVHDTFGKRKGEMEEYNTGIYYKDEKTQDKTKEASKSALEKVKDMIQKVLKEEEGYSKFLKTDDNPEGKTKGLDTKTMNKILMNVIKDLDELKQLGEGVIEEELCPKGKAYIKKRQAAGEKSSAYLSGRAVKVCKGQMKG